MATVTLTPTSAGVSIEKDNASGAYRVSFSVASVATGDTINFDFTPDNFPGCIAAYLSSRGGTITTATTELRAYTDAARTAVLGVTGNLPGTGIAFTQVTSGMVLYTAGVLTGRYMRAAFIFAGVATAATNFTLLLVPNY